MHSNTENVLDEYNRLKSFVRKRKAGFDLFIEKLKTQTSWLIAPASMGLAVRSLYLIAQTMALSDDGAQAICYHDVPYIAKEKAGIYKERPLTLLLHYADYFRAHILENNSRPTLIKGGLIGRI